ncbi:ABC transporter permease [Miltoncostaea oceani]|uniref:ABC transporter permease n=1 Tax=Miltoncostaea oceani TaxID=2843216 RepID=UPI001C3D6FE6|nr:ABC transporter permease [Miltoncostaea oceani]
MSRWRGAALVAEREIRERLRTKSFAVITAILVLAALAAVIVPSIVGDDGLDTATVAVAGAPEGLGDAIAAAGRAQDLDITVRDVAAPAARAQVVDEEADAALIDRGVGERSTILVRDDLDPALRAAVLQALAQTRLVAGLSEAGVPPDRVAALTGAPDVAVESTDPDGPSGSEVGVGILMAVLLYVALLFAGTLVATGVAEEKTSRVSEVLLSSLRPIDLLVGKVAGIGLVSLGQLLVAAVPAVVVALVIGAADVPDATVPAIVGGVVWFVAGYALYASAYGALGALVGRQQEVGQVTAPLAILLLAGYLAAALFGAGDPEGTLVRVLSFIPPFAPLVMPLRIATDTVSIGAVAVSLALTLATAAAVLAFGARVYRGGITRTGARTSVRQALGG